MLQIKWCDPPQAWGGNHTNVIQSGGSLASALCKTIVGKIEMLVCGKKKYLKTNKRQKKEGKNQPDEQPKQQRYKLTQPDEK